MNSVEFSPDGGLLVTAGDDDLARAWTVRDGAGVVQLRHDTQVMWATYSPDSRFVATAGRDGQARIWICDSSELALEVCRRVGRDLTEKEWQAYMSDEPYRSTRRTAEARLQSRRNHS